MEILQQTNERFREGIRVRVVRVESLTSIWVRIDEWPKITHTLNWQMLAKPTECPKVEDLRPGMFVAVLANFGMATFWDRAILLQASETGYTVFLVDWGVETQQAFSSIRLLPRKFTKMPPWAKKIRLPGVRDQPVQVKHRVAGVSMIKRSGCLLNIDRSPGEVMTARLILDGKPGESAQDMAEHWLKMGYVDPE